MKITQEPLILALQHWLSLHLKGGDQLYFFPRFINDAAPRLQCTWDSGPLYSVLGNPCQELHIAKNVMYIRRPWLVTIFILVYQTVLSSQFLFCQTKSALNMYFDPCKTKLRYFSTSSEIHFNFLESSSLPGQFFTRISIDQEVNLELHYLKLIYVCSDI